MGSHPTLDQQDLAAEALKLDPDDWSPPARRRPPGRRAPPGQVLVR
jgi:hypothetical protein